MVLLCHNNKLNDVSMNEFLFILLQLFEYDSVVTVQADVHFPIVEMLCNSIYLC